MATPIQTLQNLLAPKDPLRANETRRILLKEGLQAPVLDYVYNHRECGHWKSAITRRAANFLLTHSPL